VNFKKLTLGGTIVGASVIALSGVAFAHDATLTGRTDCRPTGKEWAITWTVSNDYKTAVNISGVVNGEVGAHGSKTFDTQRTLVPASQESYTGTIHEVWPDEFSGNDSATVHRPEECVPETTTTSVQETTTVPETTTSVPVTTVPASSPPVGKVTTTTGTPASIVQTHVESKTTLPATGADHTERNVLSLLAVVASGIVLTILGRRRSHA
jgi:hypothetical protein